MKIGLSMYSMNSIQFNERANLISSFRNLIFLISVFVIYILNFDEGMDLMFCFQNDFFEWLIKVRFFYAVSLYSNQK